MMPKKETITTFLCRICSERCEDYKAAFRHERLGVAMPEFKRHEVIKLVKLPELSADVKIISLSGSDIRVQNGTRGVIGGDGGNDNHLNPHLPPFYYEVWFNALDKPHHKGLAIVARDNIKRVTIRRRGRCPLCASDDTYIKKISNEPLLSVMDGFPVMHRLPVCRCSYCGVDFFTLEQSRHVEEIAREQVKWPLADTCRLLKEQLFRY